MFVFTVDDRCFLYVYLFIYIYYLIFMSWQLKFGLYVFVFGNCSLEIGESTLRFERKSTKTDIDVHA